MVHREDLKGCQQSSEKGVIKGRNCQQSRKNVKIRACLRVDTNVTHLLT